MSEDGEAENNDLLLLVDLSLNKLNEDLSPQIQQQAERLKRIDLNDNQGKIKRQTNKTQRDHPYRRIPKQKPSEELTKKKERYPPNMTFLKSLRYIEYSPRQNDLDDFYLQFKDSLRQIFQKPSLSIDDHRQSPPSTLNIHRPYLCRRHR